MAGKYKAKRKPYYFPKALPTSSTVDDTQDPDSLLKRMTNLNISNQHPQATTEGKPKPFSNSQTKDHVEASTAKQDAKAKATDVDDLLEGLAKVKLVDTPSTCSVRLRDYQKTLLTDVLKALNQKEPSVLVYLPTGGGKTVIAAHLIEKYCLCTDLNERRCLFVVNRNALVDQTAKALDKCGFEGKYAFIKSKYKANASKPVQIASIQTFTRRSKKTETTLKDIQNTSVVASSENEKKMCDGFELIILDEAHGAVASQYLQLLEQFPKAAVVGLTATPFRLNPKEDLGKVFKRSVVGPTISELIEEKFLVKPLVFAPSTAKFSSLTTKAASMPEILDAAVAQWKRKCLGLRTIAFCASIKQSKSLVKAFQSAGVKCLHIDGSTEKEVRDESIASLQRKDTDVVCSVGVLSEGFDMPALEALILLRPTKSKGLYIQQIGRGLRTCPNGEEDETAKEVCIILDEVGNAYRHGLVDGKLLLQGAVNPKRSQRSKRVADICKRKACTRLIDTHVTFCSQHKKHPQRNSKTRQKTSA